MDCVQHAQNQYKDMGCPKRPQARVPAKEITRLQEKFNVSFQFIICWFLACPYDLKS